MNASPIMPDRPRPSSVSASPVATWLVTSVSVRKANSSENAAPTAMAANTPSHGEPVVCATAKPVTAPMIIMPSTPRLSTPERSTTSSPMAAIRSGVAAVAMVMKTASNMACLPYRAGTRPDEADTVVDQRVAGEHEEQDQPLEGAHHLVGQADRDLRRLPAEIGQRQHQPGRDDAERVQPAEEGDDDGGEAVADRQLLVQVPHRARHFRDAGKPRQRARDEEGEHHHPPGGKAGEAPCPRALPQNLDLEALERA